MQTTTSTSPSFRIDPLRFQQHLDGNLHYRKKRQENFSIPQPDFPDVYHKAHDLAIAQRK
ncbi:hypothetical protein [Methanosphaerula palustris]|uniref:hypothetical protein n=1 Tax=Methanosphaerula palustris TaxID=475088 RepID=UPI0011D0768B|nr:hypothetical protein [Methanosphaerula palustris]